MVAGGLAGASPHMISATVTAISRLVFEFRGASVSLSISLHLTDCPRHHLEQHAVGDLHDPPRLPHLR